MQNDLPPMHAEHRGGRSSEPSDDFESDLSPPSVLASRGPQRGLLHRHPREEPDAKKGDAKGCRFRRMS